ncbi:unnamed protein product [Thelazia callipaeda]|uniref:BAR domain-containing protein n=1 Tax=Thelazia callipaeda TaxID=103827 RepID=A0A0N5CZL0_THECL|nr:unnamed protein product [Thelazia callipaeda]
MELLPTIRAVADELMSCSDAISRKFHLKNETTITSENLAVSIKLLIPRVAEHKEYAKFLQSQSQMYDMIGTLQRTLFTEIQDRVTNPLKTWVMSDYGRIMDSIEVLKAKRWQMDVVIAEFEKSNIKHVFFFILLKDETQTTTENFKVEQCKKDYETQLAMVKADLRKIPAIQVDLSICLRHFNQLMFDYHKQMEEVLDKFGAGKV